MKNRVFKFFLTLECDIEGTGMDGEIQQQMMTQIVESIPHVMSDSDDYVILLDKYEIEVITES